MGIMTDRKIEIVAVEKLKPHPKNPYKHSADQLKLLAKSISEYQWTVPIIANKDGTILSGHARVEVAKFLKRETVPVIYVDFTEKQALAYLICDNELTKKAELDFTLFADDILELDTGDFDINLVGLTDIDVEQAMTWAGKNSVVEDEAPPIPVKAKSKLGDIYELGNHRVMCADCTIKENVDKLMAGKKADMVYCDPPYGMNLDTDFSGMEGIFGKGNKYKKIKGDDVNYDPQHIFRDFGYCKEIFLWGADYYLDKLPKSNSLLVWDKRIDEQMDKIFGSCFEICWSLQKHKRKIIRIKWAGIFGTQSEPDKNKSRLHPTQKPVKLATWFIDKFSKPSDIVLDSFLGSGSTLIACEQTKRVCYGMEIDPLYIDVIVSRYCNFVDNNKVIKNGKEMIWQM